MLEVKNLTKKYKSRNSETVYALDNVSLNLGDRGMVFLLGKSGSGKSTLLNVMGGLDSFDSGEIIINGKSSRTFREKDFDAYRNTYLGFIFQEYNILGEFTVAKNIALALELQGKKASPRAVNELLEKVDLTGYANRKPNQLSGGQKQRIAIARALIKNPDIIMADEPTGALDSKTGAQVFETLKKLSQEKLVVVVSHDRENAELFADRIIELRDGKIISDTTKHFREPHKVSGNINVINNEVYQIRDAQNLNPEAWNMIGHKLKSSSDEIMIISSKELNKEIKKIAKVTDEGNQEVFEQTKESDIQKEPRHRFRLINSKLKTTDCIKIGASGLKYKKVRLFFTILLSAIALALFGLSNTLSAFNVTQSMYESLKENGVQTTTIQKSYFDPEYQTYYGTGSSMPLTQKDYQHITNTYGAEIIKVVYDNISISYANPEYNYYAPSSMNNIYFMTNAQLKALGYKLLTSTNGHWPTSINECLISDYMFKFFQKYSYKSGDDTIQIMTVDDIIGKKFITDNVEYTITGVIDTGFDFAKYSKVIDSTNNDQRDYNLESEMSSIVFNGLYYSLILDNAYEADYYKLNPLSNGRLYPDIINARTNSNYKYSSVQNYIAGNIQQNKIIKLKTTDYTSRDVVLDTSAMGLTINQSGGKYTLREYNNYTPTMYDTYDELVLAIKNLFTFNNEPSYKVECSYYDVVQEESKIETFNLSGIYLDIQNSANIDHFSWFPKGIPSTLGDYDKGYQKFHMVSVTQLQDFVNGTYSFPRSGEHYYISNQYSDILNNYGSILDTLAEVFVYVSLGFALFSTFLLMTFIATSISYKKQEIGILRALGAKKSDVYRIFLHESLIICFINLIISLIMTIGVVIYLNHTIAAAIGIGIKFLSFGIVQLLLMVGLSIIVAVIASFLPVRKIAKMKPIDAIHNRK
ncbi:MAG: ABC transporter ATP-binding protein/permease [Clostridia bacterium]|nr:ABC transporter ATP-binding protein/permease [Clostridia bacterium]